MSLDAERAVLGSILNKPELLDDCYLTPEDFGADERHGLILTTLRYAYEQFTGNPDPFDPLLMVQHWGANIAKIGGVSYLMQLRDAVPTVHNYQAYQTIVREAYVQREAARAFEEAATGAMDLSTVQSRIEELKELQVKGTAESMFKMSEVLHGHHNEIMSRGSRAGITGAKSASDDFNEMGGGHQEQDFTVIGARPSVGKTALIVSDSRSVAKSGYTAAIFSAEMPRKDVAERYVSSIGGIDAKKIRNGRLTENDWDSYSKALEILASLPIFIDDTPGMTIEHIRRQVAKLKKNFPKLVIYIDYLQLIETEKSFSSTSERVNYISKQMKRIAREFDISVIALSQLSRDVEKRPDKRPMMSDLRESGSIEQDADVIIFLYRDDYYYPNTIRKGIIELIVAKGRKIGTGTIEMTFERKTGRFINMTQEEKYEYEKKVREHEQSHRGR
ncbi:replicative DNA helicase [Paenibacillus polymyxa]|uniref:replicative DNA helicase n=1 Tax=Paenibacillus polymyxa TaxID=1406 RepID=UPI0007EB0194|nr:replicative DNA helicase [Paenibacillus polymyxa]OAZ43371.1 hypothetical protein A9Z39_22290 [Paenibacillus polymyxa]